MATDLHVETEDDPVVLEEETKPRRRLSVTEQYERNQKIIAAKLRHKPWSKIAKENGVTVQRCKQIWWEWRETNPTLREHDPIEIVDELLYGYQASIEDYSQVVENEAIHDNIRVAALNGRLKAYREIAELLQAIGVLPNDLGTMRLVLDGQIVAERVLSVLERAGLPEDTWDELLEILGGPPKHMLEGGDPVDAEVVGED